MVLRVLKGFKGRDGRVGEGRRRGEREGVERGVDGFEGWKK